MSGLSLAAFKPRTVKFDLVDSAGNHLLTVEMAALGWSEFQDINDAVPMPEAPVKREFDKAKNQWVETADKDDPAWQEAVTEALVERQRRKLIKCLIKAGNFAEWKSQPIEEQVKLINEFDVAIAEGLFQALNVLLNRARSEVVKQAETFRSGSVDGAENVPENGVVANGVAVTAAG
jgi:hypothetical protein